MAMEINAYNYYAKHGNRANGTSLGTKVLGKPKKEEDSSLTAKVVKGSHLQEEDSIEISPEGWLAAEQDKEVQEMAGSDAVKQNEEETQELTGSDAAEQNEEGTQELTGSDAAKQNEEERSGKVSVNEGKRARQIAAAKNRAQVQQVLALLQNDLAECKAGLEKGWCDESEIAKVEALLSKANARLSQVSQKTDDDQEGIDAFDLASLM